MRADGVSPSERALKRLSHFPTGFRWFKVRPGVLWLRRLQAEMLTENSPTLAIPVIFIAYGRPLPCATRSMARHELRARLLAAECTRSFLT